MKYGFFGIPFLAIAVGIFVWVGVQYQSPTHRASGMMRQLMAGGTAHAAQSTGQAASNYSNLCASCHGAKGNGNGPAAAALNPKPRDFADCKVMGKISDDTLFKTISGGGQKVGLSPLMPSWSGSLSDQQIHDLVRYVRGFCKK